MIVQINFGKKNKYAKWFTLSKSTHPENLIETERLLPTSIRFGAKFVLYYKGTFCPRKFATRKYPLPVGFEPMSLILLNSCAFTPMAIWA